ncbi:unnamed protein product [Darwinula stevensoni]|uniref:Uncharacterized protein n=1 Tax=Darwinula stevensoni TaxID=69355 RepID=A0A7R9AGY9_9CRUS|nr:unnamed protein product [Darwinula stevensoni]CAG0904571.1 unnamed protein product [Darwinula stevensoni]
MHDCGATMHPNANNVRAKFQKEGATGQDIQRENDQVKKSAIYKLAREKEREDEVKPLTKLEGKDEATIRQLQEQLESLQRKHHIEKAQLQEQLESLQRENHIGKTQLQEQLESLQPKHHIEKTQLQEQLKKQNEEIQRLKTKNSHLMKITEQFINENSVASAIYPNKSGLSYDFMELNIRYDEEKNQQLDMTLDVGKLLLDAHAFAFRH